MIHGKQHWHSSNKLLLFLVGLSFMAQFLQSLPASKAAHVARRHVKPDILNLQFQMFGWGLPIAKGAAHAIKVPHLPCSAAPFGTRECCR